MDTIFLKGTQVSLQITLAEGMGRSRKKDLERLFSRVLPPVENFLSRKAKIELVLHFCGIHKITTLNRDYRGVEKETDVLSFPLHDFVRNSDPWNLPLVHLGDIFICTPIAMRQAAHSGISFDEEVVFLFVHALLHLLGHDHESSPDEAETMARLEKRLAKNIYTVMNWKEIKDERIS